MSNLERDHVSTGSPVPLATRTIAVHGAIAGLVLAVRDHPNGQRIRLSDVDLGLGRPPVQIVFGGDYPVQPGDLVPVAPPGARAVIEHVPMTAPRTKKMRSRRYRGMRSHGMLCSLNELGWTFDGPDEVATLRNVNPGAPLDEVPPSKRFNIVDRHRILVTPPELVDQSACHEVDRLAAKD